MEKKPSFLFFVLVMIFLMLTCTGCKNNEDNQILPTGTLLQYQGCKQENTGSETGIVVPNNQDCLEYSYEGQKLILKHVNAGFNCCPGKITADIVIIDSVITITEREQEAGCFCLCLFDLDYEIENLQPGEYTIRIHEPYVHVDDQVLESTIMLTSGASGTYCLDRNYYPWGL